MNRLLLELLVPGLIATLFYALPVYAQSTTIGGLELPRFSGHLTRGDNVALGGVHHVKKTTVIH